MKTAFITGGLRGIGLGISQSLLNEGFSLALCGTREPEFVAEPLNELQRQAASGQQIRYYRCNVGEKTDRDNLLQAVRSDFPSMNVLVNNAGVGAKVRDDLLTMTEENYDWLMKINLQGPFFLTQEAARWMTESKQGNADFSACIVNISSVSATTVSL
ncbi:MAG: SDR family NAD(P)-dependent oxidoreductase, partial [Planctomycetaceae bacterium]|nr:SDR family NAD(P)-dependent oxidoreductase [Planctomycetaceae bacterium]